ncbi:translation initiation factor IF-2 [Plesiocystis pacifica SIR-1]|uniref:Translation initiation factor IF-2 n=1 Tax=Plesiocystis pacifica SIR-1 TaxID=391625 RepID=A6GK83_9BACT|nr:translation initiation factor IF-2 [Plesiocystis pacifica]EDM73725.1 translation initiation factor IF-2 [Plesiocystis pacifica SIR-1]
MAKIRIYELARELGIKNNKDLVAEVKSLGIPIKGVMSTLSDDEANRVRRRHSSGSSGGSASGDSGGDGGRHPDRNAKPKVIRRRSQRQRPADREREKEKEREQEEAARVAAQPSPAPAVRRSEVRRRGQSPEASRSPERRDGSARQPARAPSGSGARAGEGAQRRAAAQASPGGQGAEPSGEAADTRIAPKVGDRIELPRGTRRFRDGLAAKIERREEVEERRRQDALEAARKAEAEARAQAAEAAAKKRAAEKAAAAVPVNPNARNVVRNEDGVIVAAASRRSEPTILGFIPLQTPPRRREVIITEANKGRTEGRATARKRREEKAQARGRRRPSRFRRGPSGPKQVSTVEMSEAKKRIRVDEVIQISDMAHQMGVKAARLIRTLWQQGMRNVTINSSIDVETAEYVAAEFGYTIENVSFQEDEILASYDDEGELRAPVVTIMGHVDHGKTTLLDYIRKAKVADGEAGGITQHIGAYRVDTNQGPVVFIDTPGHEAFTAMRSRGAAVTDIVVLIVAADDGVMPTTQEAIDHARKSDVPIIVAVNKIDKPEANVGRVEQMLMKEGLVGEDYGGETVISHISAKTGEGVDELLDLLGVQAEVLELVAPVKGPAAGTVIESRVDKGRGTVATVLVQAGELKKGDIVVANEFSGKVRNLLQPGVKNKRLKSATPSTPVEVLGLDGAPPAGMRFHVVESERDARQLVAHRREKRRRKESVLSGPSLLERIKSKKVPILKIVLKADVQGSAEALKHTLEDLSASKVRVEVIHAGVGGINETDVKLAMAAENPLIIGFNVKAVGKASKLAEHEKVPVETFSVIYEASDRVRERMIDLLEPEYREVPLGTADVRALFPIPRLGTVAGCRIIKGKVTRSSHVRVRRAGRVIYEGRIGSLRVFKDDVKEVKEGMECGIVVEGFSEVEPEDQLEAFELETIRPELE